MGELEVGLLLLLMGIGGGVVGIALAAAAALSVPRLIRGVRRRGNTVGFHEYGTLSLATAPLAERQPPVVPVLSMTGLTGEVKEELLMVAEGEMILRDIAGRNTAVYIRRRGDGSMFVRFAGTRGYGDPSLEEAGLRHILGLMKNWRSLDV